MRARRRRRRRQGGPAAWRRGARRARRHRRGHCLRLEAVPPAHVPPARRPARDGAHRGRLLVPRGRSSRGAVRCDHHRLERPCRARRFALAAAVLLAPARRARAGGTIATQGEC